MSVQAGNTTISVQGWKVYTMMKDFIHIQQKKTENIQRTYDVNLQNDVLPPTK